MMRVPPHALAVLAGLAFANCSDSRSSGTGPAVRDSAGIRIVESVDPTWSAPWRVAAEPTVTIGSAEADTTQLLYRVTGALRLRDGRVVIANSGTQELLLYDASGTYAGRAGGSGGGPGEFQSLTWLSRFTGDTVVAMDVRQHRLSLFDAEGRFVRSVRLEPTPELPFPGPVGLFDDGSLLVTRGAFMLGATGPTRVERDLDDLYRYDPDGARATVVGAFPGWEMSISPSGARRPDGSEIIGQSYREFGRATALAAQGRQYYVADNDTYEIKVFDVESGLTMLVRRSIPAVPVTDADVRALRESQLARITDPERRRQRARFVEQLPDPPATMPAYAAEILLDRAGNLWVREYEPPGTAHPSWAVFDMAGAYLGTVDVPTGLRLRDVGDDYVLGSRTDEDGVEYVALYRLTKG